MCQLNLECYQQQVNLEFGTHLSIPVLYFTQMIGLAMGMPMRELGIGEELVDPRPALSRIGSEMAAAAAAEPQRPRKDDKALPMPAPLKRAVGERAMTEEVRIGVYICHCGSNIAGTVDVAGSGAAGPAHLPERRRRPATTSSCARASGRR